MPTSSTLNTPILEVRGLTKRFVLHHLDGHAVTAFEDVCMHVTPGEHLAIAGASGAGKSSLLKTIYRTYLPTSGSVRFRTRTGEHVELSTMDDGALIKLRDHEIGYVSQFLRPEPRRTALDVIVRSGLRRGLDLETAQDAAVRALRMLNLREDLWGIYPVLLSGGEQQRVNLAAATICAPRLLLLDEPVSALDPANADAVLAFIQQLTDDGVAVVGVFHDRELMTNLADRVLVLARGRVAAVGAPDAALALA